MSRRVVTLDVRPDIREGREPFSRIMNAVRGLRPDEDLRLLTPFEPVPLFQALSRQGFSHHSQPMKTGDWEVLFSRTTAEAGTENVPPPESHPSCLMAPEPAVEVDARGLEPPQPLVAILEAIAALPPGSVVRARTDRRPMHLYAQLEARGFRGESEEQSDGSFITVIRHS